jgi:transcription elongation GreA/GreB family factor
MNKAQIVKQIISSLNESLEAVQKAARASHAEATHESSKAENKYDTRGLEAAYLAGGQARQAREILESIEVYGVLSVRKFASEEPVDLGALVELQIDRAKSLFFVGPRNGGLEILLEQDEITVITPQSPLGQNLMGKTVGQRWTNKLGSSTVTYRIVCVS